MPLRDHFHPPASRACPWEGVHGQWPAMMVLALNAKLPQGFVAIPRVHLGTAWEIDVGTCERGNNGDSLASSGNGGVATALWAPAHPTLAVETEPPDASEYEVRVYDDENERRLVAAVELVSPANKDRPDHRRAFAAKCAGLLQSRVAVTIVDIVTPRAANLYHDVLEFLGRPETPPAAEAPLYAVACRYREGPRRWRFESWEYVLRVGEPLPTLPLWLSEELAIPLDLAASYEETCRVLRIP